MTRKPPGGFKVGYRVPGFSDGGSSSSRGNQQFDQLEATILFCPHCKKAVPVRKRLLLALPEGDKYDYLCTCCGNSAGTKIERSEDTFKIIT